MMLCFNKRHKQDKDELIKEIDRLNRKLKAYQYYASKLQTLVEKIKKFNDKKKIGMKFLAHEQLFSKRINNMKYNKEIHVDIVSFVNGDPEMIRVMEINDVPNSDKENIVTIGISIDEAIELVQNLQKAVVLAAANEHARLDLEKEKDATQEKVDNFIVG